MKSTTIFATALLALATVGTVNTTSAQAEEVYLYTWAGFFPEQVLQDFTKQTGIEVKESNYDSIVVPQTKLMAGSTGFDVVLTAGFTTPRLAQAGVLHEIDHSKLPNLANIDPAFIKRQLALTDPEMRHSIPLDWGLTTIAYNADKIQQILGPDAPTDSLAMLFDPAIAAKLQDCGISMLDSADDDMVLALLYTGVKNIDKPTDDELKRGYEALKAVRPYVRYYDSTRYPQDLASGDLCVAMVWNYDAVRLMQVAADAGQKLNLKVMMPKEGLVGWADRLVIPKDAPHPEAAYAFLNFLLEGKSAAAFTENTLIATPNLKAGDYLKPELRDNPGIYPPADRAESVLPDVPFDDRTEREMTRYFTRVKTGG
ncbi:MAG: extracellular solute-binding protein [Rhodospirillaceae bacterium]|nr:MAG: extracellular solute-binding protein [Rhodospirillaceae bacterium]